MTRIVLIHAGPTQWDVEGRLTGDHPLPLTDDARVAIEQVAAGMQHAVSEVYRHRKNDACNETAEIIAKQFKLRARDSGALDELNLGLWQGQTPAELRFRHPKVYAQWDQNPLAVNPPEGEPLADAVERIRAGVLRILRRKRGVPVAMAVRPMAMQIVLGVLRREDPAAIAGHLRNVSPVETIELTDEDLHALIP